MSTRCQIEFYDGMPTDGQEPAARIYKHSDGYPKGVLPLLKHLQKVLKDIPLYGPRLDDPEWAAAEFVSQFRAPSDAPSTDKYGVVKTIGGQNIYRGNVYITQQIHQDIEFLYRVICQPKKWEILIFTPKRVEGQGFDIVAFEPFVEKS